MSNVIGKTGYITLTALPDPTQVRITIVRVTPNRYLVRLEQEARMPRYGDLKAGATAWVPKVVVSWEDRSRNE